MTPKLQEAAQESHIDPKRSQASSPKVPKLKVDQNPDTEQLNKEIDIIREGME